MSNVKPALKDFFTKFKFLFYVILHPFKGFWELKHDKQGSTKVAFTLVVLYILSDIIYKQFAAYSFNPYAAMPENIDLLQTILSTGVILVLWCYANWGLTTLFNGEGTIKDVFIYTTVALVPLILSNLILAPISNIMSIDEIEIFNAVQTFATIWAGILIYTGTMVTHQYGTIATAVIIIFVILGMAIIAFMAMMFFFLLQTLFNVFYVIYRELQLRY